LTGEDRKRTRLELIVKRRAVAYKQQQQNADDQTKRDVLGLVARSPRRQGAHENTGAHPALADGNPGDVGPVGDGVSELRLHYGPGYRVYFVNRGAEIVLLLCGGDKSSQARDIETAKRLAKTEE